jgi:glycosyltransferase involved in cell wall biosynthesis
MAGDIMKKFALNFICKNEGHVIVKMLRSALPITDLIVAVDTGSNDKTISIIREFGSNNNIPTFVFERQFDNFCNSRNFALKRLKETVNSLDWELETTWVFFIDCDEILELSEQFSKEDIMQDLCLAPITDQAFVHYRQFLFKLSGNFVWTGPIHEYLKTEAPVISTCYLKNLRIIARPVGASWRGNIERKYLDHAQKLIGYINEGNSSFRWVFYVGESFSAAAKRSKSKERKKNWRLHALNYYQKAISCDDQSKEDTYGTYDRIAETKLSLGNEWHEVREFFFKAYMSDSRHAEPLYTIIKHYCKKSQWETAYLFSSFAIANYFDKPAKPAYVSEVQTSVYEWELLFYHLLICLSLGKMKEGKVYYIKAKEILRRRKIEMEGKEVWLMKVLLWQYQLRRLFKAHVESLD